MSVAILSRAKSVSVEGAQGQAKSLRVVPILGPSHDEPPYALLSQETVKHVQVTEVSEQGSVPNLRVQNKLDVRVFLMDGQELIGAKQNRILNTDVLVPAHGSLTIPVSCVEQGRWRHMSPSFMPGKSASHRTRARKMARVHAALKTEGLHDADQSAVWNEVQMSLASASAHSPTSALADAYAQRERELTEFRQTLKMPEHAVGLAIFHGGKFQGLDVFDRHSTLQYFWQSLLDSYAIDFLCAPVDPTDPASDEAQAIRSLLDRVIAGTWESFASPGEGTDWRLDDQQITGSGLVWNEQVVLHLQLFPQREASDSGEESAGYRPRIRRPYMPPPRRDS